MPLLCSLSGTEQRSEAFRAGKLSDILSGILVSRRPCVEIMAMAACNNASIRSSDAIFVSGSRVQSAAVSQQIKAPRAANVGVVCSAAPITRREISIAGLTATALTLLVPGAALADVIEQYTNDTQGVIGKVRSTLSLPRDDPSRADAVDELRVLSNKWVASYRREKAVAGKPSFSNMYSVLNAISGHYVSFGPTYPIPKKRLDRIMEEVDIAEKALARGR